MRLSLSALIDLLLGRRRGGRRDGAAPPAPLTPVAVATPPAPEPPDVPDVPDGPEPTGRRPPSTVVRPAATGRTAAAAYLLPADVIRRRARPGTVRRTNVVRSFWETYAAARARAGDPELAPRWVVTAARAQALRARAAPVRVRAAQQIRVTQRAVQAAVFRR